MTEVEPTGWWGHKEAPLPGRLLCGRMSRSVSGRTKWIRLLQSCRGMEAGTCRQVALAGS